MKPARRRLGLVVPPISGHLNPALSVARELKDRGHSITYFGLPDAGSRVRAAGIGFHPICETMHPVGTVPAWMRRQGELTGIAGIHWILKCLQHENLGYMRDLPAALASTETDALLVDQISYGAASVAQHFNLPYVTLCNALPVHADDTVPPFATTWKPVSRRVEKLRSFFSLLPLRPLFSRHFAPLNAIRRTWGLAPLNPETLADSPRAILSQQPHGFEFAQRQMPRHFHLTGPWQRADTRPNDDFPFERLDDRPVIYASLGTLQNRIESVFRIIAQACAPLDVQLVMALGAHDAVPPKNLPGNPVVVPFAPQLKLLRLASLVVTHAGLNTALEALSHGVPTVAIPITNDQPGVAARLRACGAGEFIPLSRLNPNRLRRTIERVLHTASYRRVAAQFAETLSREDGTRKAADIIERSLDPQAALGMGFQPPTPNAVRIAA